MNSSLVGSQMSSEASVNSSQSMKERATTKFSVQVMSPRIPPGRRRGICQPNLLTTSKVMMRRIRR